MPVFINEMVVVTRVQEPLPPASERPGQGGMTQQERAKLMEEIARIVREYLERELDRAGER